MTNLHYLCWDKGDNLKILPANATLKDVEPDLLRSVDGRLRLKNHLQTIQDQFDFIIIDTPPTLGIFTQAPLVASTEILIPVDVGYFSLQGIRQLLEEIASVRAVFNPTLDKKKIPDSTEFSGKYQVLDIFEVISSLMWHTNIIKTSGRNRKWRCRPLSLSETQQSTTKSGCAVK